MTRRYEDSGTGNGKGGNVGNGVEVGSAGGVTNPKPLLAGRFETGVIAFAFGAQGVDAFETQTVSVDGKAVIRRNGFVLDTTLVFSAIIPFWVVTGTGTGLGVTERAAVFLPDSVVVKGSSILAHGKTGITNGCACGKELRGFGVAFV